MNIYYITVKYRNIYGGIEQEGCILRTHFNLDTVEGLTGFINSQKPKYREYLLLNWKPLTETKA